MTTIRRWGLGVALAGALLPAAAHAQTASVAPAATTMGSGAEAASAVQAAPGEQRSGFKGLLRDVGSDYRNFFSVDSAEWLAVGGVAALAVHGADEVIREELQEPEAPATQALTLDGGAQYGSLAGQAPLALGWWAIGAAMHSARGATAGRDLLRAQINAVSVTYALKYTVNRTRPNGDPRSFPSGHASAAFATAMVLQAHYGWKVGLPFFAAATYTGASRLTIDKHWASDVVFGAVVGMTCGRTVTLHVRHARLAVAPQVVPGGGVITFTAVR